MTSNNRFAPLLEEVRSIFNIIIFALGITLVVDFYNGGPLMKKCIQLQLKIMNSDYTRHNFSVRTIFGDFPNIDSLAVFFDKSIAAIFFLYVGWHLSRGLISSFLRKNVS